MAMEGIGSEDRKVGVGTVDAQPIKSALTAYQKWQRKEGIPVNEGFYIEDMSHVHVGDWARMGVRGAFINLEGAGGWVDAYVCELPPGASCSPQRRVFEELIYVVSGAGTTSVWKEGGEPHSFEWHRGSVFALPLNAWYRHFNASGQEPARLFAVTTAPLVISLFHNTGFVFENPYVFGDRYDGQEGYFDGRGEAKPGRVWAANFIPDVHAFELQEWPERGAGGRNTMLEIGGGTLAAHISEFPIGTYKKAHRHGPGAHVIILSGEGYSLLWAQGEKWQRVDWRPGSVVVPPDRWFHQHFNTAPAPARYLAFRFGSSRIYPLFPRAYRVDESVKSGGDQIEYGDEDPTIRLMYREELEQRGVPYQMADVLGASV